MIIAHRESDLDLLGTFNSLKLWFSNITIVCLFIAVKKILIERGKPLIVLKNLYYNTPSVIDET